VTHSQVLEPKLALMVNLLDLMLTLFIALTALDSQATT
jgi:hypothetical protein